MKKRNEMTAVILAGGRSRRMKGHKALLPVSGVRLIEKVVRNIEDHFQEILISAHSKELFDFLPYPVVIDKQPDKGPLVGILSGLQASATPVNFVIACDIPDIEISFLRKMMTYTGEYEIVVPVTGDNKLEPLFAFYDKNLIPRIQDMLNHKTRQVIKLFSMARVKYIPLAHNGWLHNLNTENDYQDYLKKIERREQHYKD